MTGRPGVTLLELLVVLVVLALVAGVSGLGLMSLSPQPSAAAVRALVAARAAAIRSGVPVTVTTDSAAIRFLPDGRGLGPGVDPLTGAPRATH